MVAAGSWQRILVTAGMYATAPSGVKSKTVRMSTNEINPQPGEWVLVLEGHAILEFGNEEYITLKKGDYLNIPARRSSYGNLTS